MRAWLPLPSFLPLAQTAPATNAAVTTAPGAGPDIVGGAVVTSAPATTATSQPVDAGAKAPPVSVLAQIMQFAPFIVIFIVLYFFIIRGPRKEEKNRKTMISAMKRGDEVMTVGGLIGKVVEVKEDRVVLKVDESNNVKETYLKTAIQSVLQNGSEDSK